MKIFVINLEKDQARRESMERQLAALGLDYEIFPATLGSALTEPELAKCFDERRSIRNFGFRLIPAHIGCSLSHARLYDEIARRGLPSALILEDDVILPPNLEEVVTVVEKTLDSRIPQAVLLSPCTLARNEPTVSLAGIGYTMGGYGNGYFTSSYIVNLPAVRALYRELYPIHDVADCWKRLKSYRVLEVRGLSPALIGQARDVFGSSTDVDMNAAIASGQACGLPYKVRRAFSKFCDFFYAIYRRHFRPYAGLKL